MTRLTSRLFSLLLLPIIKIRVLNIILYTLHCGGAVPRTRVRPGKGVKSIFRAAAVSSYPRLLYIIIYTFRCNVYVIIIWRTSATVAVRVPYYIVAYQTTTAVYTGVPGVVYIYIYIYVRPAADGQAAAKEKENIII